MVDAVIRIVYATQPEWWCLENPVGKLRKWLGKYVMTFHPYEFAGWSDNSEHDRYTKRTCLWGEFTMPEKKILSPVYNFENQWGGKTEKTKTERSVTPEGFAQAFFEANP